MTTKKVESINIQFDSYCNKFFVWVCYDDGTVSVNEQVFNMYDEDSPYYFHKYIRDIQDDFECYTVLFY